MLLTIIMLAVRHGTAAEPVQPSSPPEQQAAVEPIPLAEVPDQSETTLSRIRDIQNELSADRTTENVNNQLPALTREIDARMRETRNIIAQRPPIEILETIDAEWRRLRREVATWNRDLTTRASELQHEIDEIDQFQQMWTQTLNAATGSNAPAEVVRRIQDVVSTIAQARAAVFADRAKTLTTQTRLGVQDARITDALGLISQTRQRTLGRLFVRDSPPIWATQLGSRTAQDYQAESLTSFSIQSAALVSYLQRQTGRILFEIVIFAGITATLIWARRRARSLPADRRVTFPELQVLEMPMAAALLLTFLLSRWIYPQAPRLLWALIGALALIPGVTILRRVFTLHLSSVLYVLIAFYIVDQVRTVAAAVHTLPRVLFAAEMLAATIFVGSLVRLIARSAASTPQQIHRRELYRIAGAVAFGASLLALIGNVFGYVTFANLIGNALLASAYLGVILYAVIEVLTAIIGLSFTLRPLAFLRLIRRNEGLVRRRVRRLIEWIAAFFWTIFLLNRLLVREPLFAAIRTALTTEFKIGSISISPGDVIAFVVTVWASFLISRFVRFLLDEDVYPRVHLKRGLSYAISNTIHYLILFVGFLLAVAALGFDMTKVTILAGAFSVGVGFGLQNIFNNFISGLILLFERPINIGDIIQIGDAAGVVERIGIRASIIRTTNGSEVIVPNGQLISDRLVNWTLSNRQHGVELPVSVARGNDPNRVREILEQTAAAHPLVTKDPPPQALVTNLGPDSITFELRAWTDRSDQWMQVRSELAIAVNAALTAAKIAMK
ncbi:MAG TPA: mechanosensitive ion channel domain-containing protein [Candidatus Binatia bacterium]